MKLLGKALSGTCGARTYSVGGAGVTARQKVCPVNKNSLAQARRRGLFAAAGAAFKSLTALQRAELHARALAASETDVFGKKITLSDYAFFLREWMRGIRPTPSEDPSIQLLTMLRGYTWGLFVLLDNAARIATAPPGMSSETQALLPLCPTNFYLTFQDGTTWRSIDAQASAPGVIETRYNQTSSEQPIQLTFRDSLGRVFNFIQN